MCVNSFVWDSIVTHLSVQLDGEVFFFLCRIVEILHLSMRLDVDDFFVC